MKEQRTPKKQATNNLSETAFQQRWEQGLPEVTEIYQQLYHQHPQKDAALEQLLAIIQQAFNQRNDSLKLRDLDKLKTDNGHWFLSNEIAGMSLYVDRFAGTLPGLTTKLSYFTELGVNLLHLMPLFESPANASDGGYAISDFRKVSERFGNLADLQKLQQTMQEQNMYLMLDVVMNHTSDQHQWALEARTGNSTYQDYYYFYNDRSIPDLFEQSLPEVFPQAAPGNFTYLPETNQWVMTVFHNYQWDLNYTNPVVLAEMLDIMFFYANLGVDILRIDAPAFIWKQIGTTCQNLPQAHTILQLIKACVQIATPGMALLGEAIVAPKEIMKYFGTGKYTAKECDFAYNATQMALQWDALATTDTTVMLAAQQELLQKPFGTSWITYTRCHDDIGLAYDDSMIQTAGFDPYQHRLFLKNYYSGTYYGSPAKGALFSVNEKTGDARISGSLAALCGLETALEQNNASLIDLSIRKILLMQAQSFFIGGIPMLFYGDECGYTTDTSYLDDEGKNYDNRWMHRPVIDWKKNEQRRVDGTIEQRIFTATKRLLALRREFPELADKKNLTWLRPYNKHIIGFLRAWEKDRIYCLFNFSHSPQSVPWRVVQENGQRHQRFLDHWSQKEILTEKDDNQLVLEPYMFCVLQPR